MHVSRNDGDGGDRLGRDLEVTIRIARDGRVYFNDVTLDLLPVAAAVAPGDTDLRRRAAAAGRLKRGDER